MLQLIIGFKHEINPTRQWVSFVKAASCIKSKESAYKKAYEKAQQQEQQAAQAPVAQEPTRSWQTW